MIVFLCVLLLSTILSSIQGFDCGDNSLVRYSKNGLPKKLPWSVLVKGIKGNRSYYCSGIIVSPTKIMIYDCPWINNKTISLFMNLNRLTLDILRFNFMQAPTQTIKNPSLKTVDVFTVITLDKPIKANKKHAPICLSPTIPKNQSSDRVYFHWEQMEQRDSSNAIWGNYMKHVIERNMSSEMAAASYLENGKWYLGGVEYYKNFWWWNGAKPLYNMSSIIDDIKLTSK